MAMDWLRESLDFTRALRAAKAADDLPALYHTLVAWLTTHARAGAAALLQLQDGLSIKTLAAWPEPLPGRPVAPEWLGRVAVLPAVEIEPRQAGASIRRVVLPLLRGEFRGALILDCPADLCEDPGYREFLHWAWEEAAEVIRLRELADRLDDWRTRSTALLDTIPQGVVFIDHSGKRSWVNAAGARLLGIDPAEQLPPVIAEGMNRLRSSAANAGEILQTGRALFSAPDQSIRNWPWIFDDPVAKALMVDSVPLASTGVAGRLWLFDDITALHRTTEELRALNAELDRSLSRLYLVAGAADIGLWTWKPGTNELVWDERLRRWYEVPATLPNGDRLLAFWESRLHPEDKGRMQALLQAALERKGTYDAEFRIVLPAGRIRHLHTAAVIEWDPEGRPLAMIGINRDITGQRELEASLRDHEQTLNLALASANMASWNWDMARGAVSYGSRWAELLGLTAGALEPTLDTWQALLHPDDQASTRAELDRHLRGETAVYRAQYRMRHRQGHWVWMEVVGRVVEVDLQGRPVHMLGIIADITERRHAEDLLQEANRALTESETLLRDIVEHSPYGIVVYDARQERLIDNRRFRAILDLPPAWAERVPFRFTDQIHFFYGRGDYGRDRTEDDIREYFTGQMRARQTVHMERLQANGTWIEFRGIPIANGRTLLTYFDITDHKRAQGELAQAREAAETANHAKSSFLTTMSHEMRTPMNAVLGFAQMLEREALSPEQRDMVKRIRRAGRSLLSLIDDILDFSKIEAGELRIEQRPFQLPEVLNQIDSLLGSSARGKGLKLVIEQPDLPAGRLVGDPLRLEQVLVNLSGNAVKFTPHGQVTVRASALNLTATEARLRFEVQDTGIGIEAESLPRLFMPFTQADGSITRRFGGTGLGLSISKRLVELMGGRIGVESAPGQGSTFWFEIPFGRTAAAAAPATAQVRPAPRQGPRLPGLRVLVADDNPTNLLLAERALHREGATATTVADGRQVLALLQERPRDFDAVLMDLQMPVMDGLTATRFIRQDLGLASLPILAVTAGVLPEHRDAALAAGISDFLAKPIDLDELAALLARWAPPAAERATGLPPPAEAPAGTGPATPEAFPPIPGLDTRRAALPLENDWDEFRALLRRFVADFKDTADRVRTALAEDRPADAARRLHTLQGTGAALGALNLAAEALELERAVNAGGPRPDALLEAFEAELARVLDALAPWLAELPAAATAAPLDPVQLQTLRQALADRDLAARGLFEALRPALAGACSGPSLAAMTAAMEKLRFQEVLAELDRIP